MINKANTNETIFRSNTKVETNSVRNTISSSNRKFEKLTELKTPAPKQDNVNIKTNVVHKSEKKL